MNYNTVTHSSPEQHTEFTQWLSAQTAAALKAARGNKSALESAVQDYVTRATAASLELEEIEDMLGINDPSIMDVAELSAEDEEIVVDAFEVLLNL